MSTEKIKATREAQAQRYAKRQARKAQKTEPLLSKLLYVLAILFLMGGLYMCHGLWPDRQEPAAEILRYWSIGAFFSGLISFALLAAAGSALSYLKTIADNSNQ